jgi:hypothetical protein
LELFAKLGDIGFADVLSLSDYVVNLRFIAQITRNCRTKPSILLLIWACSLNDIACGGVYNECTLSVPKTARLMTQHHIGIVLLSASGMLFPRLVESTTTAPPCFCTTSSN